MFCLCGKSELGRCRVAKKKNQKQGKVKYDGLGTNNVFQHKFSGVGFLTGRGNFSVSKELPQTEEFGPCSSGSFDELKKKKDKNTKKRGFIEKLPSNVTKTALGGQFPSPSHSR